MPRRYQRVKGSDELCLAARQVDPLGASTPRRKANGRAESVATERGCGADVLHP